MAFAAKTFRYATIKQLKTEVYRPPQLQAPSVTSLSIAANSTLIAALHSNKSSVVVLPAEYKQYKRGSECTLKAHSADISDFVLSPHTPTDLLTAAVDGVVKLWSVQSATAAPPTEPTATLSGFDIVHTVRYHPAAANVIAIGHKTGVVVADLATQQQRAAFLVDGFGKDIVSTCWTHTGHLLATLSKNNMIAAFDPRTADAAHLSTAIAPTMKKCHHVMFVGGGGAEYLCLFGLSGGHRPLLSMFDTRTLTEPLLERDFEFSNGYVMPLYDRDTNLMFLTVRGSNVVSIIDVEAESRNNVSKPSIQPVHTYSCDSAAKGIALTGKAVLSHNAAEIDRLLVLSGESIDTYSVSVPRKTLGFHEELYPDTPAPIPAMTADEYFAGENRAPILQKMTEVIAAKSASNSAPPAAVSAAATTKSGTVVTSAAVTKIAPVSTVTPITVLKPSDSSPTAATADTSKPHPSIVTSTSSSNLSSPLSSPAALTSPTYVPTAARSQLDNVFKKSIYIHTSLTEPPSQHETYFDIKLGPTLPYAENIRGNDEFFALPWQVSGGSAVAIYRIGKLGRSSINQPCIKGHKSQVSTFDFSLLTPTLFASATYDGDVRIYRIPENGLIKDLTEHLNIYQTQGKVSLVRFHPYINDLLIIISSSFDMHLIEFYQISTQQIIWTNNNTFFNDMITDISFHPYCHLFATSSKDGKIRIINIAKNTIIAEFNVVEGTRDTKVIWIGTDRLLVSGFGSGSSRSLSLWSIPSTTNSIPTLLETIELERGNSIPIPRYDDDTHLLFVAHYGGSFEQLYEIRSSSPYFEYLNTFQTNKDCLGLMLLSKYIINIKNVEILKCLKLTKDSVQPISHFVPRKRMELFQDDVYPPTAVKGERMTISELLSGTYADNGKPFQTVSLQPAGMTPLSQAAPEELTDRQKRYAETLSKNSATTPKTKGALGYETAEEVKKHFVALATVASGGNRWDAKQDNSRVDVEDSEWD